MKTIVRGMVLGSMAVWFAMGSPSNAVADEACLSKYMKDFRACRDVRRKCICRMCPKDPECLCPDGSPSNCATQKKAVYGCAKSRCTQSIMSCTARVRSERARCVQSAADREAQRVKSQFRAVPPQGRGFFDYLTKVIQLLRDQKVAFTGEVRRRIAAAFSAIFKGQQAFMNAFKLLNPAEILKMEEQKAFRN